MMNSVFYPLPVPLIPPQTQSEPVHPNPAAPAQLSPNQSTVPPSLDAILEHTTTIADFCAAHAATIDENGAFPVQEFQQIAEAGLLAAPLQPHLGGLGLGLNTSVMLTTLQVLKQLGRGNLAVGRIYEGHVNALQLVQTFGTAEQIETYARDARDRHKIFGVWNAEAGDGVRLIPLGADHYRLDGAKVFCSGAGHVDRPFVNGTLPDGRWQMCIVPMDEVSPDIDPSWWQPLGMRATASYRVDFTGVEVDRWRLIGQADDYERQPWLTSGVVRFAAVQLGAAEALFDCTRQYLQDLDRGGHAMQQQRLGQMAIALESGNLWLQGAAERIAAYAPVFGGSPAIDQPHAAQLTTYANMMRTAIEQICIDMMQLCQRSVGTRGLLPPLPMERLIRDLTLYLRQPVYDAALTSVGDYALSNSIPARSLWNNTWNNTWNSKQNNSGEEV